ncbi:histidine kinase [Actinocatenispora thailandica]|uniref:histidine kinase n=1 Tax=Actinocatenispora thailandica TaxID=227318 RepID=A0A7R7DKZ4_9ACTN|nr:ATP-binding protein [Actinocatenispora thailandica]BCJ33615.1 histidine kinase [Actinocatenispora thailandica]
MRSARDGGSLTDPVVPPTRPTSGPPVRPHGFVRTLLRGGVAVVAMGATPVDGAADPTPQPAWRRVTMLLGADAAPGGPDALMHRSGRYLLIAPAVFRTLALPVPVGVLVARFGATTLGPVLPLAILLAVANIAVIALVLARPVLTERGLRIGLVVDLGVAVAVNVLAAPSVPGDLESAYHDVFWGYLIGTVALWSAARGVQAAVAALVLSVPTQLAMVWLSPAGPGELSLGGAIGRFGALVLTVVLTVLVLALVGMGIRLAMLIGMRAGRQAERARMLRGMHDTVLQALEAMALSAGLDHAEPASALAELRATARSQAGLLRRTLDELTNHSDRRLTDDLAEVVGEAVAGGLPVELVVAHIDDAGLPVDRREAMRDAVREALRNTRKHAGRCDAVVRVDEAGEGIRVVVRDHGRGFVVDADTLGFGLAESVRARLAEVGGRAEIESRPSRGTRITLWVPR